VAGGAAPRGPRVYTTAADISAWGERAKRNLRQVCAIAFQDICGEILRPASEGGWPVVTGFSRNSWFASINQLPQASAGTSNPEASYIAVAASFELGDVLYFGNMAAYARRLELGFIGQDSLGRQYNQQGRFIVQNVMNRADEIFAAAAARVEQGNAGAPEGYGQ
jgi:hypothetical protein